MTTTRHRLAWMAAIGLLVLAGYYLTARVWQPIYAVKAAVRGLLFAVVPLLWDRQAGRPAIQAIKQRIWPNQSTVGRSDLIRSLVRIALTGIVLIIGLNLLAQPLVSLFGVAGIVAEIKGRTHAQPLAMAAVLLYIPLVNSLVEEYFFRGFLFLEMAETGLTQAASLLSASLFALYHLAIFRSWFAWPLLILVLLALAAGGWLLNRITSRYGSVLPAWLLHGLVNVAILSLSIRYFMPG